MRGIGTDEEALIELICTKSNEQLEAIKETYTEVIESQNSYFYLFVNCVEILKKLELYLL